MRKNGPIFGNWVQRNAFLVVAIVKHFYDSGINKKKTNPCCLPLFETSSAFQFHKIVVYFFKFNKTILFSFSSAFNCAAEKLSFEPKSFKSLRPSRKCRESIGWCLISLRFMAQLSHWMETIETCSGRKQNNVWQFSWVQNQASKEFFETLFSISSRFHVFYLKFCKFYSGWYGRDLQL